MDILSRSGTGWNKLHPTVAATIGGILFAAVLSWAGADSWVTRLDFTSILLRRLLPFLLFAGALHIDPSSLRKEIGFVAVLSSAGVVIATVSVGILLWHLLALAENSMPLTTCLLFGALISPTDPVAVLAAFRRVKVPRGLAITVGAESLFNDGFAVIMFLSLLGAAAGSSLSVERVIYLFIRQTGGGLLLGAVLGEMAFQAVEATDMLPLQIVTTAALAFGGYTIGNSLGVSGLLATILAGMRIGSRSLRLKAWWTIIDGGLNIIVFGMLGLCVLKIPWTRSAAWLGAAAVPIVLVGRLLAVAVSMGIMKPWRDFIPGTFRALTWGGLRGAIPLALALSLPDSLEKPLMLAMTFVVGVFSLTVQGSTLGEKF